MPINKRCETCTQTAIATERYCPKCRKALLKRLQDEGYLTPDPYCPGHDRRDNDNGEDTRETKYGIDG